MEETIGYAPLFSAEEWDTLEDWEPDPDQPHKVTVWYPPGENKGNDDRYEVHCDACGHISAEDSLFEAEKLAVLHEILRARPVESWSVER
jgi:hypothetical protein